MNHFVVSDLHLCDGGPRDRFAWNDRPKQFDRFLNFVEQQDGRLIIAGDLFDLWQCNFSRSVKHYGPLLDRLAAMHAIYVVGNHDIDLLHFTGTHFLNHPLFDTLCGPFVLNNGRRRIKIMHGHEADKYCSNEMPDFSRILATITGLLEDKNGGPMKGRSSIETCLSAAWKRWSPSTSGFGEKAAGSRTDRRSEAARGQRRVRDRDWRPYAHPWASGGMGTTTRAPGVPR